MIKAHRPIISAIVAMSENRVIGKNNQLPWRLPADLRHFKMLTTGNPILMGRKTYASIGKPLPDRTNIIITRDLTFAAPGCVVATSIDDAVQYASSDITNEMFVIGGAEVYQQLMPHIERIYLTLVHHHFEGDTCFPEIDKNEWKEIESVKHEPDLENPFAYSFIQLERF